MFCGIVLHFGVVLYADESFDGDGGSLDVPDEKTFVECVPEGKYAMNVPERVYVPNVPSTCKY